MIVGIIIGITHSGVNDISLVNSEEEDQVPYSPESDGDSGKDNGSKNLDSSLSCVFSEEVNHETCSQGDWHKEKE